MQPPLIATDRILIVDDEPDIVALDFIPHVSRRISAPDGAFRRGGNQKAKGGGIALIVLDLMLPDMSGFDVITALRADPACANCAFLMLTALREDSDRIKGLSLGADDYLTKPFNPDELVLRVAAILRRARAPRIPSGGRQHRTHRCRPARSPRHRERYGHRPHPNGVPAPSPYGRQSGTRAAP